MNQDAKKPVEKAKPDPEVHQAADEELPRPTPTQEENDLARLGKLDIDAKAPHGAAETSVRSMQAASGAGYLTKGA